MHRITRSQDDASQVKFCAVSLNLTNSLYSEHAVYGFGNKLVHMWLSSTRGLGNLFGAKPLPEPMLTQWQLELTRDSFIRYHWTGLMVLASLVNSKHKVYMFMNWVIIVPGNGLSPSGNQAILWTTGDSNNDDHQWALIKPEHQIWKKKCISTACESGLLIFLDIWC